MTKTSALAEVLQHLALACVDDPNAEARERLAQGPVPTALREAAAELLRLKEELDEANKAIMTIETNAVRIIANGCEKHSHLMSLADFIVAGGSDCPLCLKADLKRSASLLSEIAEHAPDTSGLPRAFSPEPPEWAVAPDFGMLGDKCGYCGGWCQVVRPGKTQCPSCLDDPLTGLSIQARDHLSPPSKDTSR